MSTKKKDIAAESQEPTPQEISTPVVQIHEPAPLGRELVLRVRVLKSGISIAGGTAARGATLQVKKSAAEYHAGLGEVTILGTV